MEQRLLRIEEVAAVLNVSKARCYELARNGVLPVVRIGRQLRIHPGHLNEWLAGGGAALPGGWRREVE